MEGADRSLGIFLQVIEKRCLVARLHAFQDREVQFEGFLHRIEYAAGHVGGRIAGDFLNPSIGQQVQVEFGPHPLEHAGQPQGRSVRRVERSQRIHHAAQHRRVVPRMEGEALMDHHRGKIRVQHCRAQRILGAADDHWLIDEQILRPSQATPFHCDSGPSLGRCAGDDQHLEVRRGRFVPAETGRQDVGHRAGDFAVRIPVGRVLPERPVQQGGGDAPGQRGDTRCVVGFRAVAQCRHQLGTRIAVELFDYRRFVERCLECRAVAASGGPCLGGVDQVAPAVLPRGGRGKKSVDALRLRTCCIIHRLSPSSRHWPIVRSSPDTIGSRAWTYPYPATNVRGYPLSASHDAPEICRRNIPA